jgi:hypothetical protein
MKVLVIVSNAEWLEGCADDEDHTHPTDFEAVVEIPSELDKDDLAMRAAIHDALMDQCNCCVLDFDCDYEVLSCSNARDLISHEEGWEHVNLLGE